MTTNRTGCDLVCVGLIVALSFAVIAIGRFAFAQEQPKLPLLKVEPEPTEYTFMEVSLRDKNGNPANEKFFDGRLPTVGEAVEMVYVGDNKTTGAMKFQLRVRPAQ